MTAEGAEVLLSETLTASEAAAVAGVSRAAVNLWIKEGKVRSLRRGRWHFIDRDELATFLRTRRKTLRQEGAGRLSGTPARESAGCTREMAGEAVVETLRFQVKRLVAGPVTAAPWRVSEGIFWQAAAHVLRQAATRESLTAADREELGRAAAYAGMGGRRLPPRPAGGPEERLALDLEEQHGFELDLAPAGASGAFRHVLRRTALYALHAYRGAIIEPGRERAPLPEFRPALLRALDALSIVDDDGTDRENDARWERLDALAAAWKPAQGLREEVVRRVVGAAVQAWTGRPGGAVGPEAEMAMFAGIASYILRPTSHVRPGLSRDEIDSLAAAAMLGAAEAEYDVFDMRREDLDGREVAPPESEEGWP